MVSLAMMVYEPYKVIKSKRFVLYLGGVFNEIIIPLALVGYEMIITNSALRASLAIYQ